MMPSCSSLVSPRLMSRAASSLTKDLNRIDIRKMKRANCAVYGYGLSASDNFVTSRETHKPLRIAYCNLREIRRVASGFGFSLFASRNKIYGAGLNNKFQIAGSVSPDAKGGKEEYYISGRRVGGFPEGEKVVAIAAGRAHSLAIVGDKVYAWGDNMFGQCGVHPDLVEQVVASGDSSLLPPVALPSASAPIAVHCLLDTSFVLTADGKVYAFGLNEDGQCANGEYGIQPTPALVQGDAASVKIVKLAGSTDTAFAIGDNGQVFVWGQNEYGQAGPAFEDDIQLSTSRALSFDLPKIVDTAASATTCAALTQDGQLLTWGVGTVGLGPDVAALKKPTLMPQQLFDGHKISRVFGGNVSMAAVNEEGNMFVWGQNRYGHLGLGHTKDQFFPFPLFFQEDVKDVSIGPDHTLVVAK